MSWETLLHFTISEEHVFMKEEIVIIISDLIVDKKSDWASYSAVRNRFQNSFNLLPFSIKSSESWIELKTEQSKTQVSTTNADKK